MSGKHRDDAWLGNCQKELGTGVPSGNVDMTWGQGLPEKLDTGVSDGAHNDAREQGRTLAERRR